MSTLSLLLAFLDYFNENVENVIATIYIVIAYHQLFGYSWWGTLWRCICTALAAMAMMILPLVTVPYIKERALDKSSVTDYAFLWILIAVVVLVTVILLSSYYISRYKSKKASE